MQEITAFSIKLPNLRRAWSLFAIKKYAQTNIMVSYTENLSFNKLNNSICNFTIVFEFHRDSPAAIVGCQNEAVGTRLYLYVNVFED